MTDDGQTLYFHMNFEPNDSSSSFFTALSIDQ